MSRPLQQDDRVQLVVDGRPVLSYLLMAGQPPTAADARPLADSDTVASAVMTQLPGWQFSSSHDRLTDALLQRGCTVARHGHLFTIDLLAHRPDSSWQAPELDLDRPTTGELRVTPLDRPARELVGLSLAAYPPGHPDAETQDPSQVEADINALLTGGAIGPLLDASAIVWDADTPVAMTIINRMPGEPPMGGPWVSEVCRAPDAAYRGVGSALLRNAMVQLAGAGEASLSLVVTEGNPAREAYERLGFRYVDSFRKLQIPPMTGQED
ncbi:MAG TPA: GNAT family N-acetyltransferase [Actinomycetes bacterium]|nr:GNAT family N-acetyltransferase [Actinomycetes bacterium]